MVHNLTIPHELHGTTRRPRVERAQGRFVRIVGWGENEVGMRDREKEGQVKRLLGETGDIEDVPYTHMAKGTMGEIEKKKRLNKCKKDRHEDEGRTGMKENPKKEHYILMKTQPLRFKGYHITIFLIWHSFIAALSPWTVRVQRETTLPFSPRMV